MFEEIIDRETARMTPILVRLYDTHRIYSLARDDRTPARAELSGIVLDMFRTELTPREAELVTDVLIGLLRQAGQDLRQLLAEKVAGSGNVPLRLALHFANDEIDVAGTVLEKSPVLNDLDLIYIIKSQGPEYWRAIALRKAMSDQVMDLLAETEEPGTVSNLIGNEDIRLTGYSMQIMARMALESETLAGPLLSRGEVPKEIAMQLYSCVGGELRTLIEERFGGTPDTTDVEIGKAVGVLAAPDKSEFIPSENIMNGVHNYLTGREPDIQEMITVLRRGDIPVFVAQFALLAEIPADMVVDILSHRYGQGFAIACKALDIEKADFLTMFFLTQRVRNVSRVSNKFDILKALSYYERTSKAMALKLLNNSKVYG